MVSTLVWSLFLAGESFSTQNRLAKRAADGGWAARFLRVFVALSSFRFDS
jgi:hypothetical protein